ncbi:MAG TPA: HEPN domain-containing protein, partial [Anaerolineaceae bacterium]|nr:HEPN domain-containing protein [Anaerolineaceae bacterium]
MPDLTRTLQSYDLGLLKMIAAAWGVELTAPTVRAAALMHDHGFHETACFLAQQATEKALKAYLYAQGERPVIGHATHQLVQRCAEYDPDFGLLLDGCR